MSGMKGGREMIVLAKGFDGDGLAGMGFRGSYKGSSQGVRPVSPNA